jgi:hypothetical protein
VGYTLRVAHQSRAASGPVVRVQIAKAEDSRVVRSWLPSLPYNSKFVIDMNQVTLSTTTSHTHQSLVDKGHLAGYP